MQILLDGQVYEIRGGVTRSPIVEWPDNIRTDGQQLRKDRRYISAWSIDDVSSGLGKKASDSESHYLWDVENVDTRIPGQKILSPALITCTINPSYGDLSTVMEYLNNIYFLQGSSSVCNAYKFAGPSTIGSNRVIGSNNSINGVAGVHVMGNNIVVAANQGNNNVAFVVLAGIDAVGTSFGVTATAVPRKVRFADLGGTVHALAFDQATSVYSFQIMPRLLGSIEVVATMAGVAGTYLSPLVSDGVKVFSALPDGIWNFDAIPEQVVDSGRSSDINPNQVLFQNYLLFKNRYSTIKYDGVNVTSVGYDRLDGLASDKMGEVTAYVSSWQRVFAAVKGATYSHILTYDGQGWQYYARWPTAGIWIKEMRLSNAPDAVDRLWCIPGNYGYPGYFMNPMINPLQAGTYSYVPSGYYTPPIYAGGMTEIAGAWLRNILTSDNVNGTNDVRIRYGLDGAIPSTILGLAGSTHSELIIGSPVGVQSYRIQPQIELFRNPADSGTSPVVREDLVHFLKDPQRRFIYEFEIDIEKTARMWGPAPNEAVLGSLAYVSNLKILAPMQYGQIATTYVKVLDQPSNEETKDPKFNPYSGERSAFVRVRVAEIL